MSMQSSTRSGGNASGLPGASPFGTLSRRAAMVGAVAVAGLNTRGTVRPSTPAGLSVSTSPDAALIDLARQLEALIGRERAAWSKHSSAEDAAFKATPDAPIRRGVPLPPEVDAMTWEERFAFLARPGGYNVQIMAVDAEHADAMAEHARVVAAIEKRHGVSRVEREASRLSDQVIAASARLAEMQATTSPGLASKACVLLAITGGDRLSRRAELENHVGLFDSLLEDAARLGVGGQA